MVLPEGPLFGGVSSLEDCNSGTAKRNPGPRGFDRGNVRSLQHGRRFEIVEPLANPVPFKAVGTSR